MVRLARLCPPDQQGVEDVRRRRVEEDVREVLAADEVDVVDPQIDGRHLVTGCPSRALPLHDGGQPAPQAVGGGEEGLPVGPGGVELGVEGAAGAERRQVLPHLGRDAVHDRCARAHRGVDVGQAEHAEPGAELGHRGAVARHPRILARPASRPHCCGLGRGPVVRGAGRDRRGGPVRLPGEEGRELQLERADGGVRGEMQFRALVDVHRDAGAGDEGEHGVAPPLLLEGEAQRVPFAGRQLVPRGLGHQLAGQHPVQRVEVLGDEDPRRVVTHDRARHDCAHGSDCPRRDVR